MEEDFHHRDVVPIYFSGRNSARFYRIAKWRNAST